ncbi:MAG: hypothetical protein L0H84_24440 [Pseudonocardia sp.]|nr:hypothetical protein [Pseudonocardia sp.]
MGNRAIRLEIRLDGESPVGRAYDDRGGSNEFAGWMGLVAVIDDLMRAWPPDPTTSASEERPGP